MTSAAPPRTTEFVDPRYRDIDAWPPATALAALLEAQLAAAAAVQAALPAIAAAAAAAAARLEAGGRLVYAGAGTSGRLAVQDAAELVPTFGWPAARLVLLPAGGAAALLHAVEGAEDDDAAAHTMVAEHALGAADVAIGVAASGNTAFTCAVLAAAAARGAVTIGIANSPGTRLLALAAHPILADTGAEPIAGSTRLKAGTAQKIVLNLLSTLLMLRLGHVYRGLMVDMVVGNAKLHARARAMLHTLTGAEDAAAAGALAAAGGNVKTAVLLLRGLDIAAARALLARHRGRLRAALGELAGG